MIQWFHFHRLVVMIREELLCYFYIIFKTRKLWFERIFNKRNATQKKGGGKFEIFVCISSVFPQLSGCINEIHVEIISSY